jgi:predicted nucleic acid-binding Zn ribbon protein
LTVVKRGGAPESLGDILPRVVRGAGGSERGLGLTTRRRESAVARAWSAAAGPELSAQTRPSTLRRGVLTVEVRSAPLLAELAGFRSQELLSRLLAADPSGRVTGLRFRPGVF